MLPASISVLLASELRALAAITAVAMLPIWLAPSAAQNGGGSGASGTMAVSLTVIDSSALPPSERFVSGTGAGGQLCAGRQQCGEPPLPRLKAEGAANSGFRVVARNERRQPEAAADRATERNAPASSE